MSVRVEFSRNASPDDALFGEPPAVDGAGVVPDGDEPAYMTRARSLMAVRDVTDPTVQNQVNDVGHCRPFAYIAWAGDVEARGLVRHKSYIEEAGLKWKKAALARLRRKAGPTYERARALLAARPTTAAAVIANVAAVRDARDELGAYHTSRQRRKIEFQAVR